MSEMLEKLRKLEKDTIPLPSMQKPSPPQKTPTPFEISYQKPAPPTRTTNEDKSDRAKQTTLKNMTWDELKNRRTPVYSDYADRMIWHFFHPNDDEKIPNASSKKLVQDWRSDPQGLASQSRLSSASTQRALPQISIAKPYQYFYKLQNDTGLTEYDGATEKNSTLRNEPHLPPSSWRGVTSNRLGRYIPSVSGTTTLRAYRVLKGQPMSSAEEIPVFKGSGTYRVCSCSGGSTYRTDFLEKYKLKDKGYSLKQLAKISGEPLSTLQEVYNRGIGAYKTNPTSVRMKGSFKKGVDAPMSKKLSPQQWAFARTYSYIMKNPKHDTDLRLEGGGHWKDMASGVARLAVENWENTHPGEIMPQWKRQAIANVLKRTTNSIDTVGSTFPQLRTERDFIRGAVANYVAPEDREEWIAQIMERREAKQEKINKMRENITTLLNYEDGVDPIYTLPVGSEDTISTEPITTGTRMVDFHNERVPTRPEQDPRYYTRATYDSLAHPKTNPSTRQLIADVDNYIAHIEGQPRPEVGSRVIPFDITPPSTMLEEMFGH
jgi:hypothetical protein